MSHQVHDSTDIGRGGTESCTEGMAQAVENELGGEANAGPHVGVLLVEPGWYSGRPLALRNRRPVSPAIPSSAFRARGVKGTARRLLFLASAARTVTYPGWSRKFTWGHSSLSASPSRSP